MAKKKRRYLVGFTPGDEQCVYGMDDPDDGASYTQPMTFSEAKKQLAWLDDGVSKTIFELKPVTKKTKK